MSLADDTEWAAFIGMDHFLPMVTQEAVANALVGFQLPLQHGKQFDWLATAVRRALAATIRMPNFGSKRASNAEIRANLERLAGIAESTWKELFLCGDDTEMRIFEYAWQNWDGEGGMPTDTGLIIGEPLEFQRFKAAIIEMNWLSSFLRQAGKATESQQGPWRQSEDKRQRIERGRYLAPVFEAAFGQPVSANNFPTDARIKKQTPFMDFYGRMVTLAFGARETANLTEVVKAACQFHRQQPVEFTAGLIPGL